MFQTKKQTIIMEKIQALQGLERATFGKIFFALTHAQLLPVIPLMKNYEENIKCQFIST